MKTSKSKILIALFATLSSLNAAELIAVSAVSETGGPEYSQMTYTSGDTEQKINISNTSIIATNDVATVIIGEDPLVLIVELTPDGRNKMMKGTADMTGKRLAIIVNGRIQAAPIVQQAPLGGRFHISGFKKPEETKAIIDAFTKKKG
jgi:preprotein translocase subunit SecD